MFLHNVTNRLSVIAFLLAVFFVFTGVAVANAQEKPEGNDAVQANNPLANFTAFNLQNYYIGELTDPDKDANQFWLRFAKPFSVGSASWIMRASLPINTMPVQPKFDYNTGMGDLNVFAAYLIDVGNPAISFGVGPQITAPTASNNKLGSEKWSAGLVNTLFNASSKKIQYGYLLSWQGSFAGPSNRDDVNLGTFQPFVFYQLGGGTYLRSSAICAYDFNNAAYSVPVGFGVGKVIPHEKVLFNIFVEPQVSLVDRGAGWPKWQIFFGINTQF